MSKFVVDANVGIKWVLSEVHSEVALRLFDHDYELLVPDFFFPEIGNILWKRIRRGEITPLQAQNGVMQRNVKFTVTVTLKLKLSLYFSDQFSPMQKLREG